MEHQVKNYLQDKYELGPDFTNNTELFSSGMIDSFGVLELIVFLEETYKIEIDTTAHEIIDFNTINSIIRLVTSIKK